MQAHPHAAARKKGPRALGRRRGGFSTQLHVARGQGWRPAGFCPDRELSRRCSQAVDLRTPPLAPARQVLVNLIYDPDALPTQIAETDGVAVMPPRPNRWQPPHSDTLTYRDRNQVERFLNCLKQFRRTATRYDKLAHSYAVRVQLRAIILWLN